MFYLVEVEDYIRVEPRLFGLDTVEAVKEQLNMLYTDYQDKELGIVVDVFDVMEVSNGIIIPGDGAAYYKSKFKLVIFKLELQEIVYGVIEEITNFGAFMDIGATRGMIHISQTMDDYVSASKSGSLTGKSSKRTLNVGDECIARVIALSYRGEEAKVGLTMRQPGLGKIEWIKIDKEKSKKAQAKALKSENKVNKK